ncbi:hypothetical protein X777_01859 [Ooceraea biroi]|uniref:Uncharacterized protein n=1 Tax=Ooceraea biroi TaxID=2015173 RepID=A0A026X5S5_OOCBI|nr:hypothetical protein X777_01859 [Ooceraea biroi]
MEEGKGSEIARRCWEEIRKRAERGEEISNWERGREEFFKKRGWDALEIRKKREEGETLVKELMKEGEEIGRRERWQKIKESKYNVWYKYIKGEGIPRYMKKGWGKTDGKGWRNGG